MEWLIDPSLTRVIRKVSPTLPRSTGPGTCPLKVMRVWVTPPPTCMTCSMTVKVCSWSAPGPAGARTASKAATSSGRTAE